MASFKKWNQELGGSLSILSYQKPTSSLTQLFSTFLTRDTSIQFFVLW